MEIITSVKVQTPNGEKVIALKNGKLFLEGKNGDLKVVGTSIESVAVKTPTGKTASIKLQAGAEMADALFKSTWKEGRSLVIFDSEEDQLNAQGKFGQDFYVGDKLAAYKY